MVRLLFVRAAVSSTLSLVLVAALFSQRPALAGPSSAEVQGKIKGHHTKIRALRHKIAKYEEKMANLSGEETTVVRDFELLDIQLNKSRARLREIRSETETLQSKTKSLGKKKVQLMKDTQSLEGFAAQRLVAYYKLGNLGCASILFSSESLHDLFHTQAALQRILEVDANLWNKLQHKKQHLETVSQDLKAQQLRLNHLQVRCKQQQTEIAQEKAERARLLARIRTEKNLTIATIASLKSSAKELQETIRSLERSLRTISPDTLADSGAFLALKGSLPVPASGDLSESFGSHLNEGHYYIRTIRSGVTICAEPGSPVRAVYNGLVIYADWFRGYGNIIIIDHGDHYYTLSAQLEQLFKNKGDTVHTGEALGTVGDTGALAGQGLYFEIRHHGKPLNPALWFKK